MSYRTDPEYILGRKSIEIIGGILRICREHMTMGQDGMVLSVYPDSESSFTVRIGDKEITVGIQGGEVLEIVHSLHQALVIGNQEWTKPRVH